MYKLTSQEIQELKCLSGKIRQNIVKMIANAQSGHPGGSLSSVEILSVLYKKCMKICPKWDADKNFENRDRFVLSKGHASAVFYAILAECGYFETEELMTFRKLHSRLQGHPSKHSLPGVEVSTGSLGQGLSMACGMALGLKLDNKDSYVYVLMGDGEMQEGQVWEGMMNAAHHKLDNMIAFVDRNRLQIDGDTEQIKSLGHLTKKISSFGWQVLEVDGHNVEQIFESVQKAKEMNKKFNAPVAIVANTIKGRGVWFMENNANWHGLAPNEEECKKALEELRSKDIC